MKPDVLILITLFALGMTLGACDECDDGGKSWCEGNTLHACRHDPNLFREWFDWDTKLVEQTQECEVLCLEYEVEQQTDNDNFGTMCALSSIPCEYDTQKFCEGDDLHICFNGYVVEIRPCPGSTVCLHGNCINQ